MEKIKVPQPYTPSEKDIKNVIAPAAIENAPAYLKLGDKFVKTIFIFTYPRYLSSGWFNQIVNLPEVMDVSIFAHPVNTVSAMKSLRKKTSQIEAQLLEREEKGLVRDPMLETAFQDIETLRDTLQQGREKMFNIGIYITLQTDSLDELFKIEEKINAIFEAQLIYAKPAVFQQIEGFTSVLPLGLDKLTTWTPLNSGPASSIFPFVSTNLTSEEGILYGVNRHNNTLIVFDRFSLENANSVVFARSGAGKSYAVKLEILRSLAMGTDVLVIDPENEYERLANTVAGSFFKISLTSESTINPFEIPIVPKGEEPADVFKSHILNLVGLLKLMLKGITPEEDAILDRAITETYASRGITAETKDFTGLQPPLLEDLESVLMNMEGGRNMAERLYKFTKGTYAGFTNRPTNVDIKNRLIVFSVRDLEEELRPIAVYIVLNFVWNLIRAEFKKRIMVIDEAWWLMKYPDSASFLFSLVKRCRKYFLGVTTITQNVEDFLESPYGRPIITNSSIQLLLKQAPASIPTLEKTFALSEAEKSLLVEANVGEGLFFAGLNHVAIAVLASYFENKIITTNPEELLEQENM
ncbi:MAG: ATP-binding protein [Patescibacteria group bacterium]|nr:ATP-binding protein [Patescibacteria group bacterium]